MNINGKWWEQLIIDATYKDFEGNLYKFKGISTHDNVDEFVSLKFELQHDCFYGYKGDVVKFVTLENDSCFDDLELIEE